MDYKTIAVGGTFDHFHKGHEAFLNFAFSKGEKVIIGITTDEFVGQVKKNINIEPFELRKKSVLSFLEQRQFVSRALIIPIDNIYGPTLSKGVSIDGIVVTQNTLLGVEKINKKREELELPKLPVILAPLKMLGNQVISSTNIRQGEISRSGEPIINQHWLTTSYRMPDGLRLLLHKPFGKLKQNNLVELRKINPEKIVTVGDVTTKKFLENNITPAICVVDFVVERKRKFSSIKELGFTGKERVFTLQNPPSTISSQIWTTLQDVLKHLEEKKSNIILVDGEEDLLVLPLILILPTGFNIFYGQPKVGYVQIEISAKIKEEARNIFALFKEII